MRRKTDVVPAHRTKLDGFLRNEDGISAIIFAICLPVLVATAALTIDMGYSYLKRTNLQTTASASSLAGAGMLMNDGMYDPVNDVVVFATVDPDGDGVPNDPDSAVIFTEALLYAEKNLPNEDVLAAVDLHAGNWEPTTRIFTSSGTWDSVTLSFTSAPAAYDTSTGTWTAVTDPLPLNSVLAVTRRAADGPNNNPLPLFLAGAVGLPQTNINTAAIATVGAKVPNGFDGCLMAMNETEEDTFLAFGTADIGAYDCDIYINSNDECALAGNGGPVIEVGDVDNPGMIYVVGDACATNSGVDWNCNLSAADIAAGATCPETNLPYAERQVDPFEYTQLDSDLNTLKDLECGMQYNEMAADYTSVSSLWQAYAGTFAEADAAKQTGLGNFKITGQTFEEFCADDGFGNPDYNLAANCVTAISPLLDSSAAPIITGGEVVTDAGDWTWNEANLRWEFNMVPGAYCGGIEARGNGTVVFADGDYILKGKEAVDPPINGGPNPNEFDLRASVAVEGFNVAFYLADEYIEINWGGSADVAFTGRQYDSDPMNGFLFYADPSNEGPHQFRGTPAGGYHGIMYLPESDVVFKGTADSDLAQADGVGICSILIADTIYFNGTTAFNASSDGCGAGGFEIPPVGAQLVLRLVH